VWAAMGLLHLPRNRQKARRGHGDNGPESGPKIFTPRRENRFRRDGTLFTSPLSMVLRPDVHQFFPAVARLRSPHRDENGCRKKVDTGGRMVEDRTSGWKTGLCGDATHVATPSRRSEPPRPRVRPARANLRPADTASN
jgi:hypothetical protein